MAKRAICEGGYTKADAEREARRLKSRGYSAKVKRYKVRSGHEFKVCWKR